MANAAWLRLAKPIPATFGEQRVLLLDLGPSGALLSGRCDYGQGTEHELSFLGGGGTVRVRGMVTGVADYGVSPDRDLLVRFQGAGDGLAEFIARYQEQIHLAELANAGGTVAPEWLREDERGFPIDEYLLDDERMSTAMRRNR